MPRQERTKSGTGIYHVMLRGVNKQDIFDGGYAKASVASATTDKFALYYENAIGVGTESVKQV